MESRFLPDQECFLMCLEALMAGSSRSTREQEADHARQETDQERQEAFVRFWSCFMVERGCFLRFRY
jgi:hypothetical protein